MAKQKTESLLEINLLPAEFKRTKLDISWLSDKRVIGSTIALIFVALALSLVHYIETEKISDLEKAVAITRGAVDKERPLLDKIRELDQKLKEIEEKSQALRSIQVNRKRWVILLENLSTNLPPNTWIMSITQNDNQLSMNCTTWNFSEVALYMLRLEQEESITSVSLANINSVKVNGEDAYNFSINIDFDKNLGLEAGVN